MCRLVGIMIEMVVTSEDCPKKYVNELRVLAGEERGDDGHGEADHCEHGGNEVAQTQFVHLEGRDVGRHLVVLRLVHPVEQVERVLAEAIQEVVLEPSETIAKGQIEAVFSNRSRVC